MKVAHIHIDCCRECPYSGKTKHPMIKRCTQQEEKEVRADEIDDGCPLEDETWDAKRRMKVSKVTSRRATTADYCSGAHCGGLGGGLVDRRVGRPRATTTDFVTEEAMEHKKVTCDGCGADISATGNSIDYRLLLTAEELPHRGMCVTDMMIYPPIKQDAHFCGLGCLRAWLDKTLQPRQGQ